MFGLNCGNSSGNVTISGGCKMAALKKALMRPLQMMGLCRSGCAEEPIQNIPLKTFTKEERIEQWDYVNSVYLGPERDMKTFPNPSMPDRMPPVRLGIFPASWFDFMYPKTGVSDISISAPVPYRLHKENFSTAHKPHFTSVDPDVYLSEAHIQFVWPYVFGGGLSLLMLSKELMVIDHYFWEIPCFWGAVWFVNYKFGAKIKGFYEDKLKLKEEIIYSRPLNEMKADSEKIIQDCERLLEETETAVHLYQAKKENVTLQLEAAYRQRLLTAYQEAKKRLDYETAREAIVIKFEQDHMVDWIVSNVTKSITPQQEKESIQSCIKALEKLAAKEAVSK